MDRRKLFRKALGAAYGELTAQLLRRARGPASEPRNTSAYQHDGAVICCDFPRSLYHKQRQASSPRERTPALTDMHAIHENVRTVIRYRWLLYELVVRDLKLRYRGSILGVFWTLLNPLLFMLVYTLVFSVYLHSTIRAFPLFLLAGMIPWMWISGAIMPATTAVLDGRAYVGKTLMPTELLVLVPVLSNGVNFLITIALTIPVAVFLQVNVGWALLFLPILTLVELCMLLGFSFLAATANVFYRDLQQLVGYVVMALFFLTPIFYARTSVPPAFQFIVTFNPIAALIFGFQDVLYYGRPPSWRDLLFAAAFSVIALIVALGYFNRNREAFGEYV
jgi:lipopolysaccharide transport system permease protein